jgi:hypothetical protein
VAAQNRFAVGTRQTYNQAVRTINNIGLATLMALLLIVGCSHQPKVIKACRFVAITGESVLAQTKTHFQVEYDSSGVGVFVKAVDSVSQTRTAYWLYFVNGKPAPVSCEEFVPAVGDTIEWRLVSGF